MTFEATERSHGREWADEWDELGRIDFDRFDGAAPGVVIASETGVEVAPEIGCAPVEGIADGGDQEARSLGEIGLDSRLTGVPVADRFPNRFENADESDVHRLVEARIESTDPREWADLINPGGDAATATGIGRLQNCMECARAVQETLEGRPKVAGALAADGLSVDSSPTTGEHPVFTEEWAGKQFEDASYEEIGERLRRDRGSAIVIGYGPSAPGHAFNAAVVDGKILSVDGQAGMVTEWPDPELATRFPETRAIFFPDRSNTP